MIHLTEENSFLQLLHWNKEFPAGSVQDPLGLNLRLAARIATKLLHCITSITPRARYYSFYAWCLQDYFDNEKGTPGDRGWSQAIVQRERALVLGSVLHHDGHPCDGGGLGGSNRAEELVARGDLDQIDLARWHHLKNREGNFGQAYKGSLINLGYFETHEDQVPVQGDMETAGEEVNEDVQQYEISGLQSLAYHLAESFAQSVAHTQYMRDGWSLKRTCSPDVLKEFGSAAGLCELASCGQSIDRSALREVFFSTDALLYADPAHRNRRLSLTLILWLVQRCEEDRLAFTENRFNSAVFYHRIPRIPTEDEPASFVDVVFPSVLRVIAERWRQFYFHYYLTVALQSLFVSVVREIRGHPAGITKATLLRRFESQTIQTKIAEILGVSLAAPFLDLTPTQTLQAGGISLGESSADSMSTTAPDIASPLSERSLSIALLDDELANQAVGPALALTLFFVLLSRYQRSVRDADDRWHKDNVYDPYSDASLPGITDFLRRNFGDQWGYQPNREIFAAVLWRFVIKQHEIMSYERGFGGSPALLRVDGDTVIPTEADYVDPSVANGRLPSAVQILKDLALMQTHFDEDGLFLTADGMKWLQRILEEEASDARA